MTVTMIALLIICLAVLPLFWMLIKWWCKKMRTMFAEMEDLSK